jgi:hypothetical protein
MAPGDTNGREMDVREDKGGGWREVKEKGGSREERRVDGRGKGAGRRGGEKGGRREE